ncbi:MAG: hypothetical protein Fur0022_18150 [Anaerolineales bacterium]
MNKRTLTILSISLLFFVGIGILVVGKRKATATPLYDITIKEWPSFEMIYEVTTIDKTYTAKLTYKDSLHWRVDFLTDSTVPEAVGTWAEYDGKEIRSLDPFTGEITVNREMPSDGVYIPNEWLWPAYIPNRLIKSKGEIINESNGIATLTFTEYLSCDQDIHDYLQQEGQKPCTVGVDRVEVTVVKYRTDYDIPLSIVETIDGEEVRRITVTELTILD